MVVAAMLLLGVPSVQAASKYESGYSYQQTFGSALRLLKVDLGLSVSEVNPEWGYLLFVYTSRESGKRPIRGSFSFVKRAEQRIQVMLQLAAMPSYHEQRILEKLRHKLVEEHGAPPSFREAPEEKKPAEPGEKSDKVAP